MQLRKISADIFQSNTARIVAWVVFVLIAATVLSIMFWGWLGSGESNSSTIRNIGLVVAAMIGLPLAIWRSTVAERQSATSQLQSETAQRGLLNERYQKGAEMLGSAVLAVRLGGIYALDRLAREHPEAYHLQIMNLLCAFVRNPTTVEYLGGEAPPRWAQIQTIELVREDVKAVISAICGRSTAQIEIENKTPLFILDLSGADLPDVNFFEAALAGNADRANLERTVLIGTDLSGAVLNLSNLKGANFERANLERAKLIGTELDGANLKGCKGLTQKQIDYARADSGEPPELKGVVDPHTGVLLVWRVLAAKQD